MKSVSCMDMGVTCPFVASGGTAEEAVVKLEAHATIDHAVEVQKMAETMTPEQMKLAMMAKVKDATPPTVPTAPAM